MQYLRRYVKALIKSVLDWTPEEQQVAILILALFLLGLGSYGCHQKECRTKNTSPNTASQNCPAGKPPVAAH